MPKSKNSALRTTVTFTSSAFKTTDTEDKPRFRGTYGDDVAIWLMMEMDSAGIEILPGLNQSDDGWTYTFVIGTRTYLAGINLLDVSRGMWRVTLEWDVTGSKSWFGGRRRGVRPAVALILDTLLKRSDKAANVWWHADREIKPANEGKGSRDPIPTAGQAPDPAKEAAQTE